MRSTRRAALGWLVGLDLVLAVAGPAEANSISMVWISTSGGGVGVGTSTLIAIPGDTAVLEIRVTATDVNAVSVAFSYSESVIAVAGGLFLDVEVCPAGLGNPLGPGFCGSTTTGVGGFASLLSPSPGLTTLAPGVVSAGALTVPPNGQTAGTFALAHITFTVVGAGVTGAALYRPGLDGLATRSGGFELPPLAGATLATDPIPEPGTLALLGLGVVVLAWSARRRGQPGG